MRMSGPKDKDKDPKRNGTERAAILLLSLGEQEAAEVMKHMGAKDVQRIGAAMTQLKNISRTDVSQILTEFTVTVEGQTSLGVGVDEYLRKVLIGALGEDKASGVIDRILFGRSSKGLEALKWMDSRAVSELIRQEHPQIISIVLAYLDPDQSAEVLALFPDWLRADVLMRIATLDGIQPSALHELDDVIEKQFAGKTGALKTSVIGGIKTAANIMNFMDTSQESAVIDTIRKIDENLGSKIQDLMFVFDDLLEVDDRGMQEVLRAVPGERLLLAMKGADDALKEKIFKNMSQRAAEMLKDDLESRGPVRLSEVEGAQKEILALVRKLAEAGTIQLGGKGEEFV
jgi:flagellar motor switch protein FliG